MDERFDIVIAGGGLVGSSLAIALDGARRADGSALRVALIEAAPPRVDRQPSYDERNLALARASVNALEALGVWPHAAALATVIQRIHVSRHGDFGAVRLDAAALGLPAFGHVLPARELGNALLARLDTCATLTRVAPAQAIALSSEADAIAVRIRTSEGEREIRAQLLVGADGTESFVRSALGIDVTRTDYAQSALVTTITPERALEGRAFERFTDSGPVALLPLAQGRAGLVLTVPRDDADTIAALDDDSFLAFVHARFGYRLGRFSRPGRRKPYPLARTLANRTTAPRAALVGNAAQTVHPLGAQGFNLGLRDALTLAELVRAAANAGEDVGAESLLAHYASERATDRAATTAFSDDLVRWTARSGVVASALRSFGFLALDALPPLKRRFALRGMGFRGDVPTLALRL